MKKQATTKRNNERTLGQVAKEMGTTAAALQAAVMEYKEHEYSVAKDVRRLEHILKDATGQRIVIRGHKDTWTLISNKELEGYEKHERKTGTWWGKVVSKAAAEKLIADMSGKEVVLG